jgi:hypothetical protein
MFRLPNSLIFGELFVRPRRLPPFSLFSDARLGLLLALLSFSLLRGLGGGLLLRVRILVMLFFLGMAESSEAAYRSFAPARPGSGGGREGD